jgi:dihydroflavonol-4-reductase
MSLPTGIAFVTGANGFLGAALVKHLLALGWQVRCLLRPGAEVLALQDLPVASIEGDLRRPESYRHALAGCTALFHLAALYTHDPRREAEMMEVNAEGTRIVLEAGREAGIARMVYVGTIGVIGQPTDGSLATEDTPFNLPQPSAYVRSKLAGEQQALALAAAGAPVVIVHPVAMLGAGDWRPTASGRRVLAVLCGRTPSYPPGGINWAPVDDVARGLILAAERGVPGRRYILGHAQGNLDRRAFVGLIAAAAQRQGLPFPALGLRQRLRHRLAGLRRQRPADRTVAEGGPERLTCNPARAIAELGMPQSSLTAAAEAAVRWYYHHPTILARFCSS